MKSLIKIRAKYISTHKLSVYLSYFLIPSLVVFALIFGTTHLLNRNTNDIFLQGEILNEDLNILDNDNFTELIKNSAIVTENKEDCDIINNIIYKNKSSSLICETKEGDITDDNIKNVFKIINDNGKYNIELIQLINGYINDDYYIIPSNFIHNEKFSDPFYYNDFQEDFNIKYKSFLDLQSLFAQFLIKKVKGVKNTNLILNLAKNSYPPHSIYEENESFGKVTIFTIVICLQFSLSSYFFNIRMINEKEQKLTFLLERHGVSKMNYFFSWLVSFMILSIIPLISYILFFISYINIHPILFFFNLLLFIFSLFSYVYFLYACLPTSKTNLVIIILLHFSSAVIGSLISVPPFPRILKIILSFIPQINIYFCSTAIDKLNTFNELSWKKLWLKASRFSFMESIIMYLVEIIYFLFFIIFIFSKI